MSTDSFNMFGCPVCGFRVDPDQKVCSRCGNEFSDSTKFECPFCGELVPQGVKQCPSCHVDYLDFKERAETVGGEDSIDSLLLDIIKLESSSVKEEEKKFSCPQCSWMLEGTETKCPKCGKSFEEDVSFQCPVCGAAVGADDSKCQECGAAFTEDEEATDHMHEEAASRLDEIAKAAETEEAPVEEEMPPVPVQEEHVPARGGSSMFGKLIGAIKREEEMDADHTPQQPVANPVERIEQPAPKPPPRLEPEPRPEAAMEEIQPTPKPVVEAEPEEGAEAPAATPAAPKKKTRKLKAKPKA